VAIGPLVGGAVVEGLSWQWIFWLNVPIGIVMVPLAWARLTETYGTNRSFDLPGLALVSAGLFGIVFGLVRGNEHGWTSLGVAGPLAVGALLVASFVGWELLTSRRGGDPMIPMEFFAKREFSAANIVSLLMYFGMFGSIFLLAQFFQTVQGYSPLQAGLRTLPWTAMPILVAPIAGLLSDRIGTRPLLVVGMALMSGALAWLAMVSSPTVAYLRLVPPFVMAGVGMSLYFAPTANLVLSAVRRDQEGKASGVNNTIREIGGVFGVAVLATVFSAVGGYATPQTFVDGMTAAVWVGAVVVGFAAIAALAIPGRKALLLRRQALDAAGGDEIEYEIERVA
jgi:EmrB/QacA subfamily drug resistance transporter